jgi:hypothetical protein
MFLNNFFIEEVALNLLQIVIAEKRWRLFPNQILCLQEKGENIINFRQM